MLNYHISTRFLECKHSYYAKLEAEEELQERD